MLDEAEGLVRAYNLACHIVIISNLLLVVKVRVKVLNQNFLSQVTHDISHLSCADVFRAPGVQTPVIVRFSTVIHERGSPETLRDPRGFAVKFYTRSVLPVEIGGRLSDALLSSVNIKSRFVRCACESYCGS